MLSYPSDEVGNHLIDVDAMDEKGVDPYKDVLTLERYRELFTKERMIDNVIDIYTKL